MGLINKEDAIAILEKLYIEEILFDAGLKAAVKAIEAMPEEPDILKCKDCDWWDKQDDSLQGRCAIYGFYPTGYWYCAGARLRGDKDE